MKELIKEKTVIEFYNDKKKIYKNSCGCNTPGGGIHHPLFQGFEEIPKSFMTSMIKNAKERFLEVHTSIEFLWALFIKQNRKCRFSGYDLDFTKGKNRGSASLDRIDSDKNYTEDNVQFVHKYINIMKSDHTDEEFLKIIGDIYHYQLKLKWDEYNRLAEKTHEVW